MGNAPYASAEELLSLTLTGGVGPILAARLLAAFHTVEALRSASPARLERVRGIGPARARTIAKALRTAPQRAAEEVRWARELGARLIGIHDDDYPPLLRTIPDPPPVLYVVGPLDPAAADHYSVAIVGSRSCTAYGIEQAERFAGVLARSGLTVVSGGARGIDTAAHRGAARAGGRTIVVLGCGLAHRYPLDNVELFDRLVADGVGAIVSELPLGTAPDAKNFPARNRLISGLSLGVVVIEAARGSGALITAQAAAEDHGREVLVVPGRVDSPASEGSLGLLRMGGAAIATSPADVIETLEGGGWHLHRGTHGVRFGSVARAGAREGLFKEQTVRDARGEADSAKGTAGAASAVDVAGGAASEAVLGALRDNPRTVDQVVAATGLSAGEVRSALTLLEIQGRVRRRGARVERTRGP